MTPPHLPLVECTEVYDGQEVYEGDGERVGGTWTALRDTRCRSPVSVAVGGTVTAVADDTETPIFSALIAELHDARANAESRAAGLGRLLADLEALHEPDGNGDCPTCMTPAPCLTLQVVRGDLSYDEACAGLRAQHAIDLTVAEDRGGPVVPTLAELLAAPTPAVDRVFATLIGPPPATDDRRTA